MCDAPVGATAAILRQQHPDPISGKRGTSKEFRHLREQESTAWQWPREPRYLGKAIRGGLLQHAGAIFTASSLSTPAEPSWGDEHHGVTRSRRHQEGHLPSSETPDVRFSCWIKNLLFGGTLNVAQVKETSIGLGRPSCFRAKTTSTDIMKFSLRAGFLWEGTGGEEDRGQELKT